MIAARLDGKEVSAYGRKLEETLLLSPTIFPLIFAALMGRFFRHVGVYLAERGTTLGRIEQLVGCQSVFTALERQFSLRCWSIIGMLSVLVWLLSPVGGQSALRLLDQENRNVSSTTFIRHMDPNSMTQTSMSSSSDVGHARSTYRAIFLAALLSSSKYQDTPMDLWGNVKLPLYRSIQVNDSNDWMPVPFNTTYGSLIGVPVVGIPSRAYSSFNIKARQFGIVCSDIEMRSDLKPANIWDNGITTWGMTGGNESLHHFPYGFHYRSLIDSSPGGFSNISEASCNADYVYLEAKVNCNNTSCRVLSMRKLDLLSDGYTEQNDLALRQVTMSNLLLNLPRVDNDICGVRGWDISSNPEKWMADPTDFIGWRNGAVSLYKLNPEVFSQRLTILWNTFFQSTFATSALAGPLPENVMRTGTLASGLSTNVTFNSTQADVIQAAVPVYKTNWKWFVALLCSSLVLLIASYAGLILKYITLAPDIIGFASSLTILNPYVPTPTGGTTLDGLERAALLHDMPVRIGDVCADESIGAIAFAKADDGGVARLDRRRLYV